MEAILEASEADATYFNDKFSHFIGALVHVTWSSFYSRIGMGVVIVGGTIFSLVLTLFVIQPCI
jgi:HAE1 family hydrophobic/amphiphilic exporter-1/multidrug efflux pump